jgi:hypothetical protein
MCPNETELMKNIFSKLYIHIKLVYLFTHNGTTFHYICPCKIKIQQSKTNHCELQNFNACYGNISYIDCSHIVWTLVTEWWLTCKQNKNILI